MIDNYQVRSGKGGTFSIYKNEHLLVYNLDCADVKNFCAEQKDFDSTMMCESSAFFERIKSYDINAPKTGLGPGRRLVLEPHVQTIKNMVEKHPNTTVRDIEKHLKSAGISFSALSAITNLARRHKIEIKA